MSGAAVVVGAATVGLFSVVVSGSIRERNSPGGRSFAALSVVLTVVTASITVGLAGVVSPLVASRSMLLGWDLAVLAWATFAFEYTGRGPVITARRSVGLVVFAALMIVAVQATVDLTGGPGQVAVLVATVLQLIAIAMGAFGVFMLVRSATVYDDMPFDRAVTLAAGGVGIIVMILPVGLSQALSFEAILESNLAILAGVGVLFALAMTRLDLFEGPPSAGHLARERVLSDMSAPMIVVDRDGRLLDTNRTAKRTFAMDGQEELGEPLSDVLNIEKETLTDGSVTLETTDGRREFEITRSRLHNQRDDTIGRSYLLRDVTERRTHEQRLDVLNRVLRHNLRNDLDAIRAFAETLREPESNGPDAETLARRIHDTSSDLVGLGTTVERADRLLGPVTLDYQQVDAGALARGLGEAVTEEYPAADVTVSTEQSSTTLRSNEELLETVCYEVVENAVKHSNQSTPEVEIRVEGTDDGVSIEVRDDGPGIPEREREILLSGEETPLRHGTGLGLWMIYWGVTRLGGELAFGENERDGSVVTLWIPDQ